MVLDDESLNKLFRYCSALTGQDADAYDLLHDAYEKIVYVSDHEIKQPLAYCRRTIKNLWIDQCRAKKRESALHESLLHETQRQGSAFREDAYQRDHVNDSPILINEASLESVLVREELFDQVWRQLSITERELLYLWAIEGYTLAELANEMNVPRGTLLSRIHRLKKRLNSDEVFIAYGVASHD